MKKNNERPIRVPGTSFDRENVLLVTRAAGVFAGVAVMVYGITFLLSFTQFVIRFSTGLFFQKGSSVLDLIGAWLCLFRGFEGYAAHTADPDRHRRYHPRRVDSDHAHAYSALALKVSLC